MNKLKIIIFLTSSLLAVNTYAQYELIEAFPDLSFTRPVDLQNAGDQSDRIFIVEQRGVIHVFPNDSDATQTKVFLDIQNSVNSQGNEEGLLGLAFHPDYENNGYFFVNYTASQPRRTIIARYQISDTNPDSADQASGLVILEFLQPESNHNGGQVAFGPDGYLHIAAGDGGGGGDDHGEIGNGQDRTTLLGNILRIDINNQNGGLNYAIPDDNPFYQNQLGFREEIFAFGLRNPWRFSFDFVTGWLWTGDVGQGAYEEIDIIENGKNYGWRIMEGENCYNPSTGCNTTGLEMPIWEYSHSVGLSITGGYVYRGASVPELVGKYIYGDYVDHQIWGLTYDGINPVQNELLVSALYDVTSFGIDESSELYICTFNGSNSKIYRFKPTTVSVVEGKKNIVIDEFFLGENYPNPFNPRTQIPYSITKTSFVEISVYDITGRLIKTLVQSEMPAGNHEVFWNGKDERGNSQSSGLFFYQMRVDGDLKQTKRLVLLK